MIKFNTIDNIPLNQGNTINFFDLVVNTETHMLELILAKLFSLISKYFNSLKNINCLIQKNIFL